MTINEAIKLSTIILDRGRTFPTESSRFKASCLVRRRLTKELRETLKILGVLEN